MRDHRSVLDFCVPELPVAAIFVGVVLKGPCSVEMPIRALPSVQVTLVKQSVQEGIKWRVSGPVSARGICSSFSKWPPGLLLQRGKPVFERELPGFQDILCKGRNPGLPHCSHIVYHLSHQGGEILIWKRQLGVISLRII